MKLRSWTSVFVLLATVTLAGATWAQTTQPQNLPASTRVGDLGLQIQNPLQSAQSQASQGEKTPSSPEHAASPREAQELFKSVGEILQFASQDTKLPIKREVKPRMVGRDEVQSYLEQNMKEDKDAKRLERSEAVLKKFGLLPRNFDLRTFLVKMLKEQVAGYYDPKTNTVNLLNWVDVEQQEPVLAHELTHALQDQLAGLEKFLKGTEGSSDHADDPSPADIGTDEEEAARQAVVEGQAMVVLLDYSLAPAGRNILDAPQIADALKQGMMAGSSDSPAFREAPIFLKETLTFPYRYGMDFTIALLASGGKELAYAGAFKDPPKTTREIMEPRTYLAHERLVPMKMLDFGKDFKGYDWFDIGAIGEFDVDVLVEQYAGREEAEVLYPEWRGGYYFAGRPKENKAAPLGVLYVSRWSSPAKASEFAAVYAKSLAQRYQKAQALGGDGKVASDAPPVTSWRTLGGRHAWLTEEGAVLIEVRGDQVLVSESLDDRTTKRAIADFWGEPKP